MKILFDLVTTQLFVGGAQEYVRKVFYSLLDVKDKNIEIWIAYDSSIGNYAYSELTPETLSGKVAGAIDLAAKSLPRVMDENNFDKLFIGCAQFWGARYDVANVRRKVLCVIHDVCDEETQYNNLNYYVKLGDVKGIIKRVVRKYIGIDYKALQRTCGFSRLIKQNPDSEIITVSEFSRFSISYHLHIPLNRIDVLWSPDRIGESNEAIDNPVLKEMIESKCRYILMTNANREFKNAKKVIQAFRQYVKDDPDCLLVTVGYPKEECKNHRILPYLSESDLINAQKNCYAFIFPTLFEGFGYPPVEAMHWAKPVLASYVTSVPEILGDAPIYFSPFYSSDIYFAMHKLHTSDYTVICERSLKRYKEISRRQEQDLATLISKIVE